MPREMISTSAETTRQWGVSLGGLLQPGDLVCLQGDLGAGKTTFVQGIAAGWGALDEVSSPTFVLVNLYRRADGGQLFHLDSYRIESAAEAEELDLDMMLSQGPLLIEWADRIRKILPVERLWLTFEYLDENRRKLQIEATGARYQQLFSDLVIE
jgi:tRNA threonylcarbamoyladenosine biosynthesis protein TsaE